MHKTMGILRGIIILIAFFLGLHYLVGDYYNPLALLKREEVKTSDLPIATSTLSSEKKVVLTVGIEDKISSTTPQKVSVTPVGAFNSELSPDGIVQYSNVERLKIGLPPLRMNAKLSDSAGNKLQDIFKQQYFEHVSPSGTGVSDLAKQSGYDYIVVGENLALGSFGSNKALLDAWMASPGHKANIIAAKYEDIGVAVGRGIFQGSRQWVAVQHFGRSLEACVQLDPKLKISIEANKNFLIDLEKKISTLKAQIDGLTGAAYLEKAEEYNEFVRDYNVRLTSLQSDVVKYNKIVEEFNACIGNVNA